MQNKAIILVTVAVLALGAGIFIVQTGIQNFTTPEQPQYTPETTNPPYAPTAPPFEAPITYTYEYKIGKLDYVSTLWAKIGDENIRLYVDNYNLYKDCNQLDGKNVVLTITHASQVQPDGIIRTWISSVTLTPAS
ncbi:MAG: hypothetical protein FWD52_00955 [Candidatus Bathyarchaeota archaeon]|nr:hypothetical protein [Candidatus Termiticorpusculum sp.]